MSEFSVESREARPPRKRGSAVAIAVVIAITIVALACIAASTVIVYAFLQNAPW
jgi:hypothetical protein